MVCESLFSALELHLKLVELVFEVRAGGLPSWCSKICTHQLLSTCSTNCIAEFSNCLSWAPTMTILCSRMPRLCSQSSITATSQVVPGSDSGCHRSGHCC